MKNLFSLFNIAVVSALLVGCSAFRPHSQTLNLSCAPNESVLLVNGHRYSSPAQVGVPRNRDVTLQCSKEGYHTSQRTIGHHLNGTGALDAVGTLLLLFPIVGVFTPGAWSLNETDVQMQLYKD